MSEDVVMKSCCVRNGFSMEGGKEGRKESGKGGMDMCVLFGL